MKQEINPQESIRANAFSMWMSSPVPMVTLVKTFDVTRLIKVSKKSGVKFNNPFLAWARYRKGWFKTTLPVSLQFHHVQMDGGQAAKFLQRLQDEINQLK